MLILHYTGMKTAQEAIDRLRDPAARVSSHYVVDEDGAVLRLVPEARRACHAGVSHWRGHSGLNGRSIGIEIVNPGHEWGYRDFPVLQLAAVCDLCLAILSRHPIPARNVVAHSDVAPDRKEDPGEKFDWRSLAENGVGLWPEEAPDLGTGGAVRDAGTLVEVRASLAGIGYHVAPEGGFDPPLATVLRAFQRHWRPEAITGEADGGTRARLAGGAAALPAADRSVIASSHRPAVSDPPWMKLKSSRAASSDFRHSRASGNPVLRITYHRAWVPACAGMTRQFAAARLVSVKLERSCAAISIAVHNGLEHLRFPRFATDVLKCMMVALRRRLPTRMTVAEFLSWDSGDASGRGWQLIDGEPVAMAPGSETHGAIQGELIGLLRDHLLEQRSPCRVIAEPGVVPRVRADRNYRVPDLGVTCAKPSLDLMVSEPVLLVEVLSPSNEADTRANIWAYTTIPSVRELLVVNSTRIEAELLRRDSNGVWPEQPELIGPGGTLTLVSVDLTIPLTALYRTTALLPPAP